VFFGGDEETFPFDFLVTVVDLACLSSLKGEAHMVVVVVGKVNTLAHELFTTPEKKTPRLRFFLLLFYTAKGDRFTTLMLSCV